MVDDNAFNTGGFLRENDGANRKGEQQNETPAVRPYCFKLN